MTDEEVTETQKEEDFELVLLLIAIAASLLLGYRNKAKIRKWIDDAIGTFK
jgi:hypothetical protein